ncbi:MAG: septum formation initiator family protein [Desulfobulbaceae bacterium]|jgi:cell division protein FtsB|nr:septum formation initiator family protein [Desulfobulbaceae bacterium]
MRAISLPQLNPYERKKLFILSAITLCFITMWILFSANGTLHLVTVQSELSKVDNENNALRTKNEELRAEITKLKTDSGYLEQVARQEGFLKRDEMVFVFK